MKKITVLAGVCLATFSFAQVSTGSDLYQTLRSGDSLLFNVGFNQCEASIFEQLISEDFEFYHDQSGIVTSKAVFVTGIKEGLCNMNYRAKRVLKEGSLEVFPMYSNGVLYGAIQTGEHRFYALYEDQPERLTSVAKFTHVWLLEDREWRLARGLSYDHQAKE